MAYDSNNNALRKALARADYTETALQSLMFTLRHTGMIRLAKRESYIMARQFNTGKLNFRPFDSEPLPLP